MNVDEEFAVSLTLLTVVGPLAVILCISTRLPVNGRLPSTWTENVPRVAVRLSSAKVIFGRTFTVTMALVTAPQPYRYCHFD